MNSEKDNHLIIGMDLRECNKYIEQEFPGFSRRLLNVYSACNRSVDSESGFISKGVIGLRYLTVHLLCDPIDFSDDFMMKVHRSIMGLSCDWVDESRHDDFLWHLNIIRENLGMSTLKTLYTSSGCELKIVFVRY